MPGMIVATPAITCFLRRPAIIGKRTGSTVPRPLTSPSVDWQYSKWSHPARSEEGGSRPLSVFLSLP
jgi:hypothetical protein